jgi:TetR/AcrR family transcriptional repressor of nem operon
MLKEKASRDAAKGETREALVTAALAEFAARGLDAPSLDAICARAGFTRGAFYVHFRDRDDLVVAAMERVLGAFLDAVIGRGDAAPDLEATVQRFAGMLVALGAGARVRRGGRLAGAPLAAVPLHRLLEACLRSPPIQQRFVSLLRDAILRVAKSVAASQAAARVRSNLDADALATLLVALALGVLTALEAGLPLDVERARKTVVALFAT